MACHLAVRELAVEVVCFHLAAAVVELCRLVVVVSFEAEEVEGLAVEFQRVLRLRQWFVVAVLALG